MAFQVAVNDPRLMLVPVTGGRASSRIVSTPAFRNAAETSPSLSEQAPKRVPLCRAQRTNFPFSATRSRRTRIIFVSILPLISPSGNRASDGPKETTTAFQLSHSSLVMDFATIITAILRIDRCA